MPTTAQYYNVLTSQYLNTSTCTNTQYISLYDYSHRQTGGCAVANSPYVIEDWRTWNTGSTTIYNSTQIWQDWCVMGNGTWTTQTQGYHDIQAVQYPLREPTEAEKKAQEEAEQKRQKARRRAKSLLNSMLTPEQREYMERHGYIPVLGSKGRRYHIRTTGGASGNVVLVGEGDKVEGRFCVHPKATHDGHTLPEHDQFLAQILHLQDDEDEFLTKANLVEGQNPVRRPLASVA